MDRIKKVCAYAFFSDLNLEQLKAKLEEVGPWTWAQRDSHYFGDYLSARAREDYSMLKIYENEEVGYQIDILFEAEGAATEQEWEAFHHDVVDRLLRGINARKIQETETVN